MAQYAYEQAADLYELALEMSGLDRPTRSAGRSCCWGSGARVRVQITSPHGRR